MSRPGHFLHQPYPNSRWYVRFVYPWTPDAPDGVIVKISLRTRDKAEAERRKLPYVARHLKTLAWIKSVREGRDPQEQCTTLTQIMPDGEWTLPGGIKVKVDGAKRDYVAPGGHEWKDEDNVIETPIPGLYITRADYESRAQEDALFHPVHGEFDCPAYREAPGTVSEKLKHKQKMRNDGAIYIQHWIDDLGIKPPTQREAWRTWNLFQELNGGKRLSEITREDATKLRQHMLNNMDLVTGTVAKNCGHLRASFKNAITNHGYKGENPFASLVSKKLIRNRGDSIEGVAYSEEEMAIVRRDLVNWREDARLLWVLCATTGMRPGEAFLIKGEFLITGIRCIDLRPSGKDESIKTEASKRRLPLPSAILPFLPERIEGKLFERSQSAVLHWANRRLKKLGLITEAKSLKSLRHRAVNRLNTVMDSKGQFAPSKLPEQITGHALEGVHNRIYFKDRHSMPVLKPWIDLVGY